jgi:hypothetical protein
VRCSEAERRHENVTAEDDVPMGRKRQAATIAASEKPSRPKIARALAHCHAGKQPFRVASPMARQDQDLDVRPSASASNRS